MYLKLRRLLMQQLYLLVAPFTEYHMHIPCRSSYCRARSFQQHGLPGQQPQAIPSQVCRTQGSQVPEAECE
jgi:hypothetical protein